MTKPLCIYHGNCADGFTAAWAVWQKFGDTIDYHAGIYGQEPPDVFDRDVIMVDFSYKRPVLDEMARRANTILILDHHKTAAEDLRGLPQPERGYTPDHWRQQFESWNEPNVRAVFDMKRSGAGIAWDFFHPNLARPPLVNFVEDRDLWAFNIPKSREIAALIFSYAYSFENWDRLDQQIADPVGVNLAISEGAAIERKHHKDVAELVAEGRRELVIGGHWVPVSNLPKTLTSDAGHLMCAPYASPNLQGEYVTPPFAACYWDTPEGRVFSLRSRGDFDVSEIAKGYGGGGHKSAAGFRVPFDHELCRGNAS